MLVLAVMGWLLLACWLKLLIPLWFSLSNRWLRAESRGNELPTWPMVSIVVPARNEGRANIEAGLCSLARLDYPAFEILAIDDRSTDDTGPAMDDMAASSSRIRVIHITELPPDWLGKNHALHRAGEEARGDWILFTDGDVQFAPDALRLAISYAETGGRRGLPPLDFLCLAPQVLTSSYFERALVALFGFLLTTTVQPIHVRSRLMSSYCGIGAFNLVRRAAWSAIGGHSRIKLDVLDDVHLGKLLKHSGFRCDLLFAGDLVRVRWQESLWGVIRGLEKNTFASMKYSLGRLVLATTVLCTMLLSPYLIVAGLIAEGGGVPAIPFLLILVLLHGSYAWYAHKTGFGAIVTLVMPAALLLFLFACWNSAIVTLRQGGVRWRETFYSLDELRANQLQL